MAYLDEVEVLDHTMTYTFSAVSESEKETLRKALSAHFEKYKVEFVSFDDTKLVLKSDDDTNLINFANDKLVKECFTGAISVPEEQYQQFASQLELTSDLSWGNDAADDDLFDAALPPPPRQEISLPASSQQALRESEAVTKCEIAKFKRAVKELVQLAEEKPQVDFSSAKAALTTITPYLGLTASKNAQKKPYYAVLVEMHAQFGTMYLHPEESSVQFSYSSSDTEKQTSITIKTIAPIIVQTPGQQHFLPCEHLSKNDSQRLTNVFTSFGSNRPTLFSLEELGFTCAVESNKTYAVLVAESTLIIKHSYASALSSYKEKLETMYKEQLKTALNVIQVNSSSLKDVAKPNISSVTSTLAATVLHAPSRYSGSSFPVPRQTSSASASATLDHRVGLGEFKQTSPPSSGFGKSS